MKPYRETTVHRGILNQPIDRVWAFHLDIEAFRSAYSRVVSMALIAGSMGEVGCTIRTTISLLDGTIVSSDSEVIEISPPRKAVIRFTCHQAPDVSESVSTLEYIPQGDTTEIVLTHRTETVPVNWEARVALWTTRSKRRAASERAFASELHEENAYYASHAS